MMLAELPSIEICQEVKVQAEENNQFDRIPKIIDKIRTYNQISITEIMEGYYNQRNQGSDK